MYLIPLRSPNHPERTPLSAATADDLIGILLSPTAEAATRLSQRLLRDPALFVWALTQLQEAEVADLSTLTIAQRLLQRSPQAFESLTFVHDDVDAESMRWADWCEETAALTHWCQSQQPGDSTAALVVIERARTAPMQLGFPTAWAAPPDLQASIQTAQERLAASDQEDTPVQAAKRYGAQSRKQFLQRSHGEEATLATLVGKLLRLQRLESDFATDLEREKLAAMKELAYGASHEINNPLANITTRAQMLMREESDPERKRKLATINSQAFKAHEMIANMMLYAHPPEVVPAPCDAAHLIETAITELRDDAERQETELRFDPPEESIDVHADATLVTNSLKALGRNALEALAAGGWVRFSVEVARQGTQAWCEWTVSDNGPGLTAEVRRHLFDPFYSGREAGRGLGFGLSICWRVAELHGGEVIVVNTADQGASFTLRIPLSAAE